MEGGSNSNSSPACMIAYGDNNNNNNSNGSTNGFMYPMMMMPILTSHQNQHQHQHHGNCSSDYYSNTSSGNILYPHLPPPPPHPPLHSSTASQDHRHNRSSINDNNSNINNNPSGSSSFVFDEQNTGNNNSALFMENNDGSSSANYVTSPLIKAKIMAHPHYNRLLAAYANCQKALQVGAPPEVVARLEEACSSAGIRSTGGGSSCLGEDPALDQFMEAYCEMLIKYEEELSKPFKEAMVFLQRVESQFKALSLSFSSSTSEGVDRRSASSEDDQVDALNDVINPQAEDRELKGQLLRKYSGYLGSLKQEFMKKKKKGKLPKEARQQLQDWWTRHYKWPYPSEQQKLALAESTGLDQKQINNWFINQRKRHWKPSEDMQFVVMDAAHPHYYMDNVLCNPFPMDISPLL